jgi:hypothetical protein
MQPSMPSSPLQSSITKQVNPLNTLNSSSIPSTKKSGAPPILTLSQIIKFVASSAAEAELAGLYVCAKEMVPLRNSLEEMGWPQPKSPIQTDNTTALGVANKTIITKKMKSMDSSAAANLKVSSATTGDQGLLTTLTTPPRHIQMCITRQCAPHMRDKHVLSLNNSTAKFLTHSAHCKGVLRDSFLHVTHMSRHVIFCHSLEQ